MTTTSNNDELNYLEFLNLVKQPIANKFIEKTGLNYHKYRYVVLPLDFNFYSFSRNNKIKQENSHLIIQYSGTTKAEVIEV